MSGKTTQSELFESPETDKRLKMRVTVNRDCVRLTWTRDTSGPAVADVRIAFKDVSLWFFELRWAVTQGEQIEERTTSAHPNSIRATLNELRKRFPVADKDITLPEVESKPPDGNGPSGPSRSPSRTASPWLWIVRQIAAVANIGRADFEARMARPPRADDPENIKNARHLRQLQHELMEPSRSRNPEARRPSSRSQSAGRQVSKGTVDRTSRAVGPQHRTSKETSSGGANVDSPTAITRPVAVVPDVPVHLELPTVEIQETLLPIGDLRAYFLRERAALWWVSNQSDDLLALPYCKIQRLEYQVRTALRTIGPLRGRALLSDEVGLGKTIEAGLVLKEYLTRGMVKRFLVVTVPSLVDQWEEELSEKFNLPTVTTNRTEARNHPEKFWRDHSAIVASLHTLKQPAHLAVAQEVQWDMLIVDEAHYLRNRTSQAWQAINRLPRQFLLLLTATPVQNSLEELYNLVTLLQPGQLPSPKEFRARFIDPKKPHQPREPEELRRLLGQVMIRNTRANAGIHLPPRRAETVLFEPSAIEQAFWQKWESDLRASLARLNPSQASMWGRLLLQTAGSSPAAWRETLKSFPERTAARAWTEQAPLEESWKKKCRMLEPLTKGEGGVVVFTQFLQTQAALAGELKSFGIPTFVVNGQTPAPERQPITESFRAQGGALLLTHSGTEGRNLQFCHRLVNFDLPWNPMEIEQRVGRLHRLGQQHPVRIYNLVQAGTLQEHLLQILQEKLNLFELVVGETGLILGERFSSDEFAEEILRRWRESEGRVAEAMESLGAELAAAREEYREIKQLDETLFSKDYESL